MRSINAAQMKLPPGCAELIEPEVTGRLENLPHGGVRSNFMPDLADGESIEMQGSGRTPYVLKNSGGVYSCTCPAWRTQSLEIEKRTCKHLRKLRGDAAETERVGNALPARKQEGDEGDEGQGPPLLLAHVWENDIDLAGWWMSEKLDGVRAY